MRIDRKKIAISRALALLALIAMTGAYFAPVWWVSLTAPNYPRDAFPDGIRIHFHFDAVYNGCSAAGKGSRLAKEVLQEDMSETTGRYNPILDKDKEVDKNASALDCVHEMNTINHYVGMYPIATGAPVEMPMAKFIFGMFGVMLLAFLPTGRRAQLAVLATGFACVATWMIVDQLVLKHLDAYAQHYYHEASAFFNQPAILQNWVDNLKFATHVAIAGLCVAMIAALVGVWRVRGFWMVLVLAPAALPIVFLVDYIGWLWFFGHHLHPWGAFTVKPFMPTVFGEGKVAQFSTYSYPYWGYLLAVIAAFAAVLAALLRRQALRLGAGDATVVTHGE